MTIKTIIKGGRTFRFDVQQEDDLDHPHPWNAEEGHGPVSEWSSRKKRPGEWVLEVDGRQRRFYDFSEAVEIAKRDGWGLPPEEMEAWIAERDGIRPTKAMIATRAVVKDFKHLKAFCDNEWTYVGVIVTLLEGEDDTPTKVRGMSWGLETCVPNIVDDAAQELVDELVAGFGTAWGYVPKMVAVEFPNGVKPGLPQPTGAEQSKAYRVTWEVDVDAETPQDAAKEVAKTYFQDRIANGEADTACVFEVEPLNENAGPFEVDLAKLKEEGA